MDLQRYLDRIGLSAPPHCDVAGLAVVHRAHGAAIPYEGLDIQLGTPLDLDPARIFHKLVHQRRGGWCYENNGLLGWALSEMGFVVQRCTAGVGRHVAGDSAWGNHLALLVRLEGQDWLCDLGLGDGLRAPVPLVEGEHRDGGLTFRLERLSPDIWRFHNHPAGSPDAFDLQTGPADEALLSAQNLRLQGDPESHFVQNSEAIRMRGEGSVMLLGRVLRVQEAGGLRKSLVAGPDAMSDILARDFGIEGVDCQRIWPRILARHAEVFGAPDAEPGEFPNP